MPSDELNSLSKHIPDNSGIYSTCWVIALRAEAAPIIKFLKLKYVNTQSSFTIYANEKLGHALIISGVGAIKSAAATAFLKAYFNINNYASWINLGIAGYYAEPVGKLYQAIKVFSPVHQRTFFPGFRFSKILPGTSLLTVDKAETNYNNPVLYDMEAFGFCEVASAFSCNELIFVFKIVSDTPNNPIKKLKSSIIEDLINENLQDLKELLSEINKLSVLEMERLEIPDEVIEIENSIHFSKTNSFKFRQLYKKWKFANPKKTLKDLHFSKKKAKEIISVLEDNIYSHKKNRDYL